MSEIQPELDETARFSADAFSEKTWFALPYTPIQESRYEYPWKILLLY